MSSRDILGGLPILEHPRGEIQLPTRSKMALRHHGPLGLDHDDAGEGVAPAAWSQTVRTVVKGTVRQYNPSVWC
jgi:hypothetical protein